MTKANYNSVIADANTKVRVGVAIVIRDEQGRILLERRIDCGLWGLPGGRIEPGESISETVIREAREETGLNVEVIRLLGVYSEANERIILYPDGVVQLIDIMLEARVLSGHLRLSEESLELKFFAPKDLPTNIVPPAKLPIRDVARGSFGNIR
jgi:ADP-ribose pyrophosphatase YjhB (NUDIX family)